MLWSYEQSKEKQSKLVERERTAVTKFHMFSVYKEKNKKLQRQGIAFIFNPNVFVIHLPAQLTSLLVKHFVPITNAKANNMICLVSFA